MEATKKVSGGHAARTTTPTPAVDVTPLVSTVASKATPKAMVVTLTLTVITVEANAIASKLWQDRPVASEPSAVKFGEG